MMVRISARKPLCGAVIALTLSGCAHTYRSGEYISHGDPHSTVYVAPELTPIERINLFCSYNEWVCILGGLAAFGGAIALVKSTEEHD